eukprot:TRINITY_DN3133_c0_g1_i1.p1 TRINITY_DN3133_c0_g1~~TRINITY_DN3133_c0_g1_i1.p1  ORF type:complete len:696 (-),score=119.88 TRINITY_DN3133_c0_g1_i1:3-1979(-)
MDNPDLKAREKLALIYERCLTKKVLKKAEMLGEGGNGAVFFPKISGLLEPIVVKQIRNEYVHDIEWEAHMTLEQRQLTVPYIGKFERDAFTFIMMGRLNSDHPTLEELLYNLKGADQEAYSGERIRWCKEVATLTFQMFKTELLHQDFHLNNLGLLNGFLVVIDFGNSRILDKKKFHTIAGQRAMDFIAAPETLLEGPQTYEKADVWSFGVILMAILTCDYPVNQYRLPDPGFIEAKAKEVAAKIKSLPDKGFTWLADLLLKIVVVNSRKRLSREQVCCAIRKHIEADIEHDIKKRALMYKPLMERLYDRAREYEAEMNVKLRTVTLQKAVVPTDPQVIAIDSDSDEGTDKSVKFGNAEVVGESEDSEFEGDSDSDEGTDKSVKFGKAEGVGESEDGESEGDSESDDESEDDESDEEVEQARVIKRSGRETLASTTTKADKSEESKEKPRQKQMPTPRFGKQAAEKKKSQTHEVHIEPTIVKQLEDMRFPLLLSQLATHATDSSGVDDAVKWLLVHFGEIDDDKSIQKKSLVNNKGVKLSSSMGVSEREAAGVAYALKALRETESNVADATEWINLMTIDEISPRTPQKKQQATTPRSLRGCTKLVLQTPQRSKRTEEETRLRKVLKDRYKEEKLFCDGSKCVAFWKQTVGQKFCPNH